jgi:hypothetical protein
MQKFENLGNGTKKRRRRGKIPKIVATFDYASRQGQRTHSARIKYCLLTGNRLIRDNVTPWVMSPS